MSRKYIEDNFVEIGRLSFFLELRDKNFNQDYVKDGIRIYVEPHLPQDLKNAFAVTVFDLTDKTTRYYLRKVMF